jgi:hypothetical protein
MITACGWPNPAWQPQAGEAKDERVVDVLDSFFYGQYNASTDTSSSTIPTSSTITGSNVGGIPLPRACTDNSMTPLQWLVHELPKLHAEHRPLLFIVNPGELLWIPDHWYVP